MVSQNSFMIYFSTGTLRKKNDLCFIHPIFRFWFLVTFGDEVRRILRNLCLHFARQDGLDGIKNGKNITQLK